ncbi:sodium channel modifier 1-like isoform X2 [Ischnura elegans]|uniref:sodium channel modifier 1-like isoform X2 n=1 Tax=Ischnura elegans TaxID=197161 RepID=UPI001ED878F1|nr:sodium channel modifier 1-like isoform X2 [Ischnura elegans]
MSFKRDTIDTSLLRNLKFRRVSEILAQQIPEDEARLLSNGRLFRCFQVELSKYLLHKRELQLKMQKSSQLFELKAASRNPGVSLSNVVDGMSDGNADSSLDHGSPNSHPLLTASPYSSCAKKRNQKIPLAMQRRMVLESPKLPGISSALVIENSEASQSPSAHSEVRRYLKGLQRKKPFSKLVERMREGCILPPHEQGLGLCVDEREPAPVKSPLTLNTSATSGDSKQVQDFSHQSAIAEHTLKLTMAGWIWDKDSEKWAKDPNVEFDSDEEEPPTMT